VDAARAAPVAAAPPAPMSEAPALYLTTSDGRTVCRLCAMLDQRHDRHCPVVTVRLQLRDLTAQLGLFVATMRETIETVDLLLRGADPPREETPP
jgi:hypothetical protein